MLCSNSSRISDSQGNNILKGLMHLMAVITYLSLKLVSALQSACSACNTCMLASLNRCSNSLMPLAAWPFTAQQTSYHNVGDTLELSPKLLAVVLVQMLMSSSAGPRSKVDIHQGTCLSELTFSRVHGVNVGVLPIAVTPSLWHVCRPDCHHRQYFCDVHKPKGLHQQCRCQAGI